MQQNPGWEINLNPTITIDDKTFKVTLFMPTKCITYANKLMKLIGEPLANIIAVQGDETKLATHLPSAVRSLTTNLDNPETLQLVKTILTSVSLDARLLDFETFFHGRMKLMVQLLIQVIQIQFADFFEGVAEAIAQIRTRGALSA